MKPNMHTNVIKAVGETYRSVIMGKLEEQELTQETDVVNTRYQQY